MAENETSIANQALARIGANRINDLTTSSTVEAIQARTHYAPTRDALLRKHWWRFAAARASLAVSTTAPDFGYSNRFPLPSDFLALRAVYEEGGTRRDTSPYSHAIEKKDILTNDSSMKILYTTKETDAGVFDPLFVEVLVLTLAIKMQPSLTNSSGPDGALVQELREMKRQVRAMDRDEQELLGRDEQKTWLSARYEGNSGRLIHKLGS